MTDHITEIIPYFVSLLTALFGFLFGRRKSNADANAVIFDAYKVAIDTLRSEFTNQVRDLNERIKCLEEENKRLKVEIDSFRQKQPKKKDTEND